MKINFLPVLTFAILGLGNLGYAQGLRNYKWHPIKQITEQEIYVVEKASHASALNILNQSVSFTTVRGAVILYGSDGVLRLYGTNSENLLPENQISTVNVSSQVNNKILDPLCDWDPICRGLVESYMEFVKSWDKGNFHMADQLVLDFFAKLEQALKTNSSFVASSNFSELLYRNLSFIVACGNRYFEMADRYTEFCGPYQAIKIYEDYLVSWAALKLDRPSQADLIKVLRKIETLSDSIESIILSEDTFKLMHLLAPEIYRKLDEKPKG